MGRPRAHRDGVVACGDVVRALYVRIGDQEQRVGEACLTCGLVALGDARIETKTGRELAREQWQDLKARQRAYDERGGWQAELATGSWQAITEAHDAELMEWFSALDGEAA